MTHLAAALLGAMTLLPVGIDDQDQPAGAPAQLSRLGDSPASNGSAFVCAVPDLNGDGAGEVLVGAPMNGREARGRVQLLSGKDGEVLGTWVGEERQGRLGSAVAAWQGPEGEVVLAFGEPGSLGGRGRVGLVRGLEAESVLWVEGAEGQVAFGFALAAGGDATGDGHADLVVGAPAAAGGGSVSLLDVSLVDGASPEVRWRVDAPEAVGHFGFDVALAPDLNGDGRAEVVVGHLGVGAAVLSGADGARLFDLGEAALGVRIGDSVAVLERPSKAPLIVVGSGGDPGQGHTAETPRVPDPGIFVFDPRTREPAEDARFAIPGHLLHSTTVGMRVRSTADFDGDGHEDLAVCQPNGYLIYGGSGRIDLRSGASDTKLGSTYYGGVGLEFLAWQFGTDACSIQVDGEPALVVATPVMGGVVAVRAGAEIGASQDRSHTLPTVWVRKDR